jgi:hypothetical protein
MTTVANTQRDVNSKTPNFASQILRRAQQSSYGEYQEIVRLVESGLNNVPAIEQELRNFRSGYQRSYIPTVQECAQ